MTPTTDGFTFDIANFQPGVVYTFDATNGGEITQAGSHVVVWNLVPGESSDVTVTATDPGVSIASADVSGIGAADRHRADVHGTRVARRRVRFRHLQLLA